MQLYDYLYADIEKIISVYSQVTGGVVEIRESTSQNITSQDNKRKYDFKVFKHDAGGTEQDSSSLTETIKPHHSVFSELEEELSKSGNLLNLSTPEFKDNLSDFEIRTRLKQTFCVKLTGRCVFEDYERIKSTAQAFPDIIAIINKSIESGIKDSAEYQAGLVEIETEKAKISKIKDRNQKTRAKQALEIKTKEIEEFIQSQARVQEVDQWVLDGLQTWIDTFLPGITNLRVYPSPNAMDTHVFGHLNKECFLADPNAIHFTYGSIPTEELTLLGIISSVPMNNEIEFDPLEELRRPQLNDQESVENAFRGVFRGFDGFESMIRTCRFPRILVYPLLVYRKA